MSAVFAAMPADRRAVFAAGFLRATANGLIGVVAGIYLAQLGFSPAAFGVVLAAGIAGAAVAAAAVTLWGDRVGRRRGLVLLALASAAGGAMIAAASDLVVLAAAAFLGMMNSLGKDRAAAAALEQAILPGTVDDAGRTRVFAWYNVTQDIGHALGAALAAAPELARAAGLAAEVGSLRFAVCIYAALLVASAFAYARLSPAAEVRREERAPAISPQSRRILWRLCALFALDSFAGGFLGSALFAYFFYARFGVGEAAIAALFVGARIMNALSHLAAAWLARRIGLINTMVFTHTPSSLLLLTIPFTDSFALAAVLFLLREGLSEMDVPTRQSYLMAVVRPEERTFAGGVTNLARMAARAAAPLIAGGAITAVALWTPLVAAAVMKVAYDWLLWVQFRKVRPPEER
jgi:MFS family permease